MFIPPNFVVMNFAIHITFKNSLKAIPLYNNADWWTFDYRYHLRDELNVKSINIDISRWSIINELQEHIWHRDSDFPAYIDCLNNVTIWYRMGKIHRDVGPAQINVRQTHGRTYIDDFYHKNGKLHREISEGPAVTSTEPNYHHKYYLFGEEWYKKQYTNIISSGGATNMAIGYQVIQQPVQVHAPAQQPMNNFAYGQLHIQPAPVHNYPQAQIHYYAGNDIIGYGDVNPADNLPAGVHIVQLGHVNF